MNSAKRKINVLLVDDHPLVREGLASLVNQESDLRICEEKPYSGTLQRPCDGTPGWVTLNLRGGWRFNRWLRADMALYNLTDARYRYHGSGFEAAGFDARSTLSVEF